METISVIDIDCLIVHLPPHHHNIDYMYVMYVYNMYVASEMIQVLVLLPMIMLTLCVGLASDMMHKMLQPHASLIKASLRLSAN